MKKTIGIIGAGNIGKAVAGHFLKAGYQVTLSNSKDPSTLQSTLNQLGNGAKGGTIQEVTETDIIILALPWSQVATLADIRDWKDKIVIDATNHFITYYPDFDVEDLGDKASSEVVRDLLKGSRIVKAFNTIFFKILEADPHVASGNRVLFVSGDDAEAKALVKDIISDIGFAPVDLGSLSVGSKFQQAKGALATLNLIQLPS